MGFEPMNVTLRGLCVKPLHQRTITMSFDIVNYITTFLAIQSYSDDFIIPPPTNMLSLYNTSD